MTHADLCRQLFDGVQHDDPAAVDGVCAAARIAVLLKNIAFAAPCRTVLRLIYMPVWWVMWWTSRL